MVKYCPSRLGHVNRRCANSCVRACDGRGAAMCVCNGSTAESCPEVGGHVGLRMQPHDWCRSYPHCESNHCVSKDCSTGSGRTDVWVPNPCRCWNSAPGKSQSGATTNRPEGCGCTGMWVFLRTLEGRVANRKQSRSRIAINPQEMSWMVFASGATIICCSFVKPSP